MTPRRVLTTVLLCALLAVSTGCRVQPTAPEPVPTPTPPVERPPDPGQVMNVYFVRGEKVGVGGREIPKTSDTEGAALSAMRALVAGTSDDETAFGLTSAIPEGVAVNGVTIDGDTATVDLTADFASGGGSLSMLLRVTQVVCTLTQFNGVEKVAFVLDGEPTKAIGGEGVIVDPPVGRSDFEGQLPAILVESPYPGQTIQVPLTVSGSSNVFEATHQLTLTSPDGSELADVVVTATSGTGERGTWSESVTFAPPETSGLGTLTVFESSAEDGNPINVVEIPVRLVTE